VSEDTEDVENEIEDEMQDNTENDTEESIIEHEEEMSEERLLNIAFGEKGNKAVLKELMQLHEKKVLMPVQKTDMMYDERKKALRYLMFLNEKCNGSIKACGSADGRPQ